MMVHDRVTPTLQKIQKTLPNLVKKTWTITLKAKDKVTDVVKRIIGFITSPLTLLGAGAGATAAIAFPLQLAGEMEQAQIAMEYFAGSAEKGQKFLERLQAFAAKTPFEFPDVREAAVGLLPLYKNMYGVDKAMDETIRTIQAFGNAAGMTGAGIQGMNLALLGFRQIGTMGKLGMEELRQVTENLLIPMDIILKELGLTGDALEDLGKRGIPAQKAMNAIVRALEKNFAGGMEKMSRSLLGLISTVKDTARLTVTAFGAGMAGSVKRIFLDLVGITDYIGDKYKAFQKKLEDAGRRVGEYFERVYRKAKEYLGQLMSDPEFQSANVWQKLSMIIEDLTPVIAKNAFELGTKLVKGVAAGFWEAMNADIKTSAILSLLAGLTVPGPLRFKIWIEVGLLGTQLAKYALGWLVNEGGKYVGEKLPEASGHYTAKQIQQEQAAWQKFEQSKGKTSIQQPLFKNTAIKQRQPTLWERVVRFFRGYAYGGIVNRPHFGVIAEAGPEAIIPLSGRMRNRGVDLWYRVGFMLGTLPASIRMSGFDRPVPVAVPVTAGVGGYGTATTITTGPISVTLSVTVSGGQDVLQVIRANYKVIANEIADVIAGALPSAFQNMTK
ncbi:MAG: tape measure protein [Pseudomonadaceae bacterium]|nr:tape measure protein [Pseudomonadaceae bacterium]